jgi:hypothetical protein
MAAIYTFCRRLAPAGAWPGEQEGGRWQARIEELEVAAEAAYAAMYDAPSGSQATARTSDAREALHDAIGLARRLGVAEARPKARLAEVKAVSPSSSVGEAPGGCRGTPRRRDGPRASIEPAI